MAGNTKLRCLIVIIALKTVCGQDAHEALEFLGKHTGNTPIRSHYGSPHGH